MSRIARQAGLPLALAFAFAAPAPARAAEGLWDSLLETLDVKAPPAAPAPRFVERSRPDPDSTRYMPTAAPHRVSPVAVKSPAEVEAAKAALDAAADAQLHPPAPKALASGKARHAKPAD